MAEWPPTPGQRIVYTGRGHPISGTVTDITRAGTIATYVLALDDGTRVGTALGAAVEVLHPEPLEAQVHRLRTENGALADALTARTHDFAPCPDHPDLCDTCHAETSHTVHQTPAEVRRRHGLGAEGDDA